MWSPWSAEYSQSWGFVNADVIAQRDTIGVYEAAPRAASERAAGGPVPETL
jgi:hypothetical protein